MTFKDLKKRVSLTQEAQQQATLFDRLRDKPFWTWSTQQHKLSDIRNDGDCCFNHIIGLPRKDGTEKPIFDYEKKIFDVLENNKLVWLVLAS